jgi:hypothetical protein
MLRDSVMQYCTHSGHGQVESRILWRNSKEGVPSWPVLDAGEAFSARQRVRQRVRPSASVTGVLFARVGVNRELFPAGNHKAADSPG